jgi:hypothetical protein
MAIDTSIVYTDEDVNKNLYRKKTYYTLVVEQEVLAKDKDEADQKFLDDGGIDHSLINPEITVTKNDVETHMVDANYTESGSTEYMGKVLYAEDDEHAEEDGNVEIDTSADEVMPDVVDTMLELESEFSRGK